MKWQRWGNAGLALLVALAVAMVILAFSRQRGLSAAPLLSPQASTVASSVASPSAAPTPMPTQTSTAKPTADSRPRAVFLGDSYTAGVGGDGTKWTTIVAERLGWSEVNLGRGGTGYVTSLDGDAAQKACGLSSCPSYRGMVSEAVAAKPAVIVISGGREDGKASVSTPAGSLIMDLHHQVPSARIIVVSPLWDNSAVPADLTGTTTGVRVAARQTGVEYVDIGQPLSGRADLMSTDGVNPNAAGYRAIADAVLAKVA